jgi:hypothetical protein
VFPNAPPDAVMEAFTALCGGCGGVQVVEHKGAAQDRDMKPPTTPQRKSWWQFWK